MVSNPLGTLIRKKLKEKNLSQRDLADHAGVTPQAVTKWLNGGNIEDDTLVLVAGFLGMEPADLFARKLGITSRAPAPLANFEAGPDVRPVPLISWVQAGQWNEIQDNFRPGEGEMPVYTTRKVGPHAYALRVVGDSMENPNGRPSYPEGSLIIVDPDRDPQHRNAVIVRLVNQKTATFKQLIIEGDHKYLKPLNPRYEIMKIDGDAVFCGVVVQTIMDEDL